MLPSTVKVVATRIVRRNARMTDDEKGFRIGLVVLFIKYLINILVEANAIRVSMINKFICSPLSFFQIMTVLISCKSNGIAEPICIRGI